MTVLVDEASLKETARVSLSIRAKILDRLGQLKALEDSASTDQRRELWSLEQLLKEHS
jgi:signal transduction histidine kinase